MLPGFSGHLLSGAFVETQVSGERLTPDDDRARRDLAAWRGRCGALGPASTPRALLQSAAAPLVAVLGFEGPSAIEPADQGWAATLTSNTRTVALIVTPWG